MEISEELQKEYNDYLNLVAKETEDFPHALEKFQKIMRKLRKNKIPPHQAVCKVVETFAPIGRFNLIVEFNAFMEEGASLTYKLSPTGVPSITFVAPEIQGSLIGTINSAGEFHWSQGT